ncbi:hypothetical protein [Longimicrobium sp.]|jgi:hypothetical protein|uniref:hypothetical protein n=1 Tax=Longimicrobium sp. TaxID=2029185 RepID=UPI002F920FF3
MDRNRIITIAVGAALLGFLLGFLPQWSRANGLRDDLDDTRLQLRTAQIENRIGAALAESLRSNYERSRQVMTTVFSDLQAVRGQVSPAQQKEVDAILAQRDEMVTLLARAAPESSQRLMLIHTRYHGAFSGDTAPATTPAGPSVPGKPAR